MAIRALKHHYQSNYKHMLAKKLNINKKSRSEETQSKRHNPLMLVHTLSFKSHYEAIRMQLCIIT